MSVAEKIINEMVSRYDEKQSGHLSRFFKTGKGEYGEGDRFLGIKVPETRSVVKNFRDEVSINDIVPLLSSEWHEIRLAGFLLMIELYRKAIKADGYENAAAIVKLYLDNIAKGNNWDLVDLVSQYILGDWILRNPDKEKILFELADKDGCLWHLRVAIVSTLALIKAGKYSPTFYIAEKFLYHKHDLIHKATGWMLREIGKRGGKKELECFLEKYKERMPRTMLRYSIERFDKNEQKYYLAKK